MLNASEPMGEWCIGVSRPISSDPREPSISLAHRRGVAAAGKDDLCNFPYCDCWTDFNIECAEVSAPIITAANATGMMEWQSYSFTVTATCDDVLRPSCGQDFYKLEFNTCESPCALMWATWKGAAALPGLAMQCHAA